MACKFSSLTWTPLKRKAYWSSLKSGARLGIHGVPCDINLSNHQVRIIVQTIFLRFDFVIEIKIQG